MEPTENLLEEQWSNLVKSWCESSEEERLSQLLELTISATYNSTKIENDAITLHDTTEILGSSVVSVGEIPA